MKKRKIVLPIIYSDAAGHYYIFVRVRPKRNRRGRIIRSGYSYFKPLVSRKKAPAKKAPARKPTPRVEAQPSWISTDSLKKSLDRKWKFSPGRTEWPSSLFKWFSPSKKFFSWRRQYPPMKSSVKYVVISAFYVVFDENEEEYYLWNKKNALTRKITAGDIAKLIKGDKRLARLSYQEAVLRLPVHIRAPQGMTWAEVLKMKPGRIEDDLEDINGDHAPSSTSGGGSYQVKEFVGWTAYPAAGNAL